MIVTELTNTWAELIVFVNEQTKYKLTERHERQSYTTLQYTADISTDTETAGLYILNGPSFLRGIPETHDVPHIRIARDDRLAAI